MQQMFPCHRCGWQNVIGQRFCGNCAEVFEYNCPHCNVIVDPAYSSCPSCGAPLVWGFEQQPTEEQIFSDYSQQSSQPQQVDYQPDYHEQSVETPAPKKTLNADKLKQKKKNQLIVIIAFIGLILCIGGAIYLGLQTFKAANSEPPLSATDNHTSQQPYNYCGYSITFV